MNNSEQIKKISLRYATTHPIKYALIAKNLKISIGQKVEVKINAEVLSYEIKGLYSVEIQGPSKQFFFIVNQLDLFGESKKVAKKAEPKPLDFGIFSDDFFKEVEKVKGAYFAGYCLKLEPWK
jgi:hypothetical protein